MSQFQAPLPHGHVTPHPTILWDTPFDQSSWLQNQARYNWKANVGHDGPIFEYFNPRLLEDDIEEITNYLIDNDRTHSEDVILNEININDLLTFYADRDGEEGRAISFLDGQFVKDMDDFEDQCNARENVHRLIASSPQGDGTYLSLAPPGIISRDALAYIIQLKDNDTKAYIWMSLTGHFPQRNNFSIENNEGMYLDSNNRVIVEGVVANKGERYDNAHSPLGPVYINKKFTKFLPEIGAKVKMIIGMNGILNQNGIPRSHPWMCIRIIKRN